MKKSITAVQNLLDRIEDEARGSYREHRDGKEVFNENIWRGADPELYKLWKNATVALSKIEGEL